MQPESYDLFLRHSLSRHIIHLAVRTDEIEGVGGGVRFLPLRVLRVIFCAADCPEVGPHGALARGGVALCLKGLLVGGDLGEVSLARLHHGCHLGEAGADGLLLGGEGCGAHGFLTQVEAVAVIGLGGRYAVGSQQHLLAVVLTVLTRFG